MSSLLYIAAEIWNSICTATKEKPLVFAGAGAVGLILFVRIALGLSAFLFESVPVDFSRVAGTVTVDGAPVAGVQVRFEPLSGGVASHGVTDANGRYDLLAGNGRRGALVGPHIVRLTTGKLVQGAGGGEAFEVVNETIGKRYNVESELMADVVQGANNCDWPVQSK